MGPGRHLPRLPSPFTGFAADSPVALRCLRHDFGTRLHQAVEPQQSSGVSRENRVALGLAARQAIDELPRKGGRSKWVVATEQQAAGAELVVAVCERFPPVANRVDVELVEVLADRSQQLPSIGKRRSAA